MLRTNKAPVLFRMVCVRHGETDGNKESRVQGHIDIPLNALGMKQAEKAGDALSEYVWTRAYSSDLSRANKTAELILKQSSMKNPPPLIKDARIKERGFGVFENLLMKEAWQEMKAMGVTWPEYSPVGGETQEEVQIRFVSFFKTLCQSVYDKHHAKKDTDSVAEESTAVAPEDSSLEADPDSLQKDAIKEEDICETVLVVSHGAALRQFYCHLCKTLGCEFPGSLEAHPLNTAYSVFSVRYSPRKYTMVCHEYNKSDHIEGIQE